MDLHITGRRALVCASSRGLGRACAEALADEGVEVVLNARDATTLERTADEIRGRLPEAVVTTAPGDLTTKEGRAAVLDAAGTLDILVLNNRGPRPATIDDIVDADVAEALELHYWAPLHLVRAVLPGMRERRFGRIVSITSAMVASPNGHMLASAGARTGQTAILKAIQRDVVRHNVTINQLLPERIDTQRQMDVAKFEMNRDGITFEEARARQAASIAAQRLGRPEELGAACAFFCSEQASYISGTSLRVDGGSYEGLL